MTTKTTELEKKEKVRQAEKERARLDSELSIELNKLDRKLAKAAGWKNIAGPFSTSIEYCIMWLVENLRIEKILFDVPNRTCSISANKKLYTADSKNKIKLGLCGCLNLALCRAMEKLIDERETPA